MVARQDKIRIEVFGTATQVDTDEDAARMSHNAVLCLAQLIGRQIAREQFARERKSEQGRPRARSDERS